MNKSINSKMIIKNTSVLRHNGDIQDADIIIEDDKIAFVGRVVNGNVLADHVKISKSLMARANSQYPVLSMHTLMLQ